MTPAGHIGVRLPAKQAFRVLALQNRIKSADLAEHGRELHPHVTVLEQVNTDDVAAVRRALANRPGGRLRFGSIGVFSNPQHDILQIEVDSPELRRLHDLLAARLPNQENWPKYQPHVTLAYLKPGAGRKYLELNQLAGEEVDVDRVVFRAPTGQRHYLQLGGAGGEAPLTKAAGMPLDSFLVGYKAEKVADTGVTLPRAPKGPQMARNELYAGADKMNKHAFLAGYMSKEAADPRAEIAKDTPYSKMMRNVYVGSQTGPFARSPFTTFSGYKEYLERLARRNDYWFSARAKELLAKYREPKGNMSRRDLQEMSKRLNVTWIPQRGDTTDAYALPPKREFAVPAGRANTRATAYHELTHMMDPAIQRSTKGALGEIEAPAILMEEAALQKLYGYPADTPVRQAIGKYIGDPLRGNLADAEQIKGFAEAIRQVPTRYRFEAPYQYGVKRTPVQQANAMSKAYAAWRNHWNRVLPAVGQAK